MLLHNIAIPLSWTILAFARPMNVTLDSLIGQDTQNGLLEGCRPVTVIFARGTTEPGNVGIIVGPFFSQALSDRLGEEQVAFQGVDYPADIPGFFAGGNTDGIEKMASLVTEAMYSCPDTRVIMSGYSQGGQLVHKAAKLLPTSITANVAGAVIFGDPDQDELVEGITLDSTLIICHADDDICQGGALVLPAHLTYGAENAGQAADFVASLTA